MQKKLNKLDATFLIIDVQEKLVNMLKDKTVALKGEILAKTANIMQVPVVVTEQYPKGLGSTISEVKDNLPSDAKFFEKVAFSALDDELLEKELTKKQVILFGIEAHICVLQTAIALINKGFEVFIVKDACGSRNDYEFNLAIERLNAAGAIITCTEMVLFELLETAKNPDFKAVQALIL